MFGAEITLRSFLFETKVTLEEEKIRKLLDSQLVENGGLV
jgi:hypothetical protein